MVTMRTINREYSFKFFTRNEFNTFLCMLSYVVRKNDNTWLYKPSEAVNMVVMIVSGQDEGSL